MDVTFEEPQTRALGVEGALLMYAVRAWQNDEAEAYEAWCTSAYCRQGPGWQLALHQQTPIETADVQLDASVVTSD